MFCRKYYQKKSKEIGFPVVLKALHKDLIHKTEYGAVKIDIKNEIQLKIEIGDMKSNLGKEFFQILILIIF